MVSIRCFVVGTPGSLIHAHYAFSDSFLDDVSCCNFERHVS